MDKSTMDYATKNKGSFYIDETHDRFAPCVRWNSNNRVPFDDMLEAFQSLGFIGQLERDNSNDARTAENEATIALFRKNFKGYDSETLAEMRNEFGSGSKVVNVLTGTVTQL